MNLLADTGILIDYWKPKSEDVYQTLNRIFTSHNVVIPGIVRAELLHGSRSKENLREMHTGFLEFDSLNLEGDDWESLGDQLYEYRTHGLTVPIPDAIIACVALTYGIPVWTKDGHFWRMKDVIPELQVYQTDELINS